MVFGDPIAAHRALDQAAVASLMQLGCRKVSGVLTWVGFGSCLQAFFSHSFDTSATKANWLDISLASSGRDAPIRVRRKFRSGNFRLGSFGAVHGVLAPKAETIGMQHIVKRHTASRIHRLGVMD